MARQYICQLCREKDIDENMTIVKVGKQNKRYHAQNCYGQYLKDQEFKKREKEEWDSCYKTIQEVCDVTMIPPSYIGLVQRLCNGDPVIGMRKEDVKHFKQGFPYPVIEQAYLQHADLIKWKKSQWNGKSSMFLQFVLTFYVLENIEDVNEEVKRKKDQERQMEYVDQDMDFVIDNQVTYKKQDDEMDISKFL